MHSLMQLIIVLLVSGTQGKRLLVLLIPSCHSHLMGMKRMATEVSERGHQVMVSDHQTGASKAASQDLGLECFSLDLLSRGERRSQSTVCSEVIPHVRPKALGKHQS
jgi:hypothetical protein